MRQAPLFLSLLLPALLGCLFLTVTAAAQEPPRPLPGTAPLTLEGDLADRMVAGIDRYLDLQWAGLPAERAARWKPERTSADAYRHSLEPARARLRAVLGVVDARVPFAAPEVVSRAGDPHEAAHADGYEVYAVRWPVLPGVEGEGLLLEPKRPKASVVALPDCDWTPEQLVGLAPGVPEEAQFARRLAESGCRVLVPALIDRTDEFAGNPAVRMTNQPHREFVYRGAFELGRHVIGYEIQKVLAAVDWLARDPGKAPIGLAGYGEGGLLALYAAAVDGRAKAVLVSGYFGPRDRLWSEPIYRNVFGVANEWADAELAAMAAPAALVVEASAVPAVSGPPAPKDGRSGAAPGRLQTPSRAEVVREFDRIGELMQGVAGQWDRTLTGTGDGLPGNPDTLNAFLDGLVRGSRVVKPGNPPHELRTGFEPRARQRRQVEQLVEHAQGLLRDAQERRRSYWSAADGKSVESWRETTKAYRDRLWDDVIGRLPAATLPPNARTRLLYDEPKYRGYEVVLDMWPAGPEPVMASGILLVPRGIRPGERRAVVVCQHGLEGRPTDAANPAFDSPYYHRFACRLADEGFVTFSPQNPYIFGDRFRMLQRKLNPLGKSLFSVIVRQHEQILKWLGSLAFVDASRIGFYGLSYGGKTAMRVPALLEGYCLSICSGDYNEWLWKNVSTHSRYSYMFTPEWEMFEWNLGNTFNYAEMAWLICPRPFMVERGHDDGVAPSDQVGFEYTRARERYDRLGIGDRTEIEFFNGPHTIHGVGTFDFLKKHLASKG